jgi:molybdopterin molybdotransferase
MAGHPLPFRRAVPVRMTEPIRGQSGLQHFLRAVVTLPPNPEEAALPTARLTGAQGSGILSSMARANALLVLPEGQPEAPPGAVVQALLLDEPAHQAEPPF